MKRIAYTLLVLVGFIGLSSSESFAQNFLLIQPTFGSNTVVSSNLAVVQAPIPPGNSAHIGNTPIGGVVQYLSQAAAKSSFTLRGLVEGYRNSTVWITKGAQEGVLYVNVFTGDPSVILITINI